MFLFVQEKKDGFKNLCNYQNPWKNKHFWKLQKFKCISDFQNFADERKNIHLFLNSNENRNCMPLHSQMNVKTCTSSAFFIIPT